MVPSRLLRREWALIALVAGFFGAITFIAESSRVSKPKFSSSIEEHLPSKIKIVLTGGVVQPGIYECDPGSRLGTLLSKIELLPAADRKKIPYKKVVYHSQSVEIPVKCKSL